MSRRLQLLTSIPFLFLFLLLLGACTAEEDVKRGVEGEFCNGRDSDCRSGLICRQQTCQTVEGLGVTCGEMCDRLDTCGAPQADCESKCNATFEGTCDDLPCPWRQSAIETFGKCIAEDLSCEEIQGSDAPDLCYSRLPIPDERNERCEDFIDVAGRCASGASTNKLSERCRRLARTTTEESWARTDSCVERIDDGFCNEIADCFNTVFELEPAIDLGDDRLGGETQPDNNGFNNSPPT